MSKSPKPRCPVRLQTEGTRASRSRAGLRSTVGASTQEGHGIPNAERDRVARTGHGIPDLPENETSQQPGKEGQEGGAGPFGIPVAPSAGHEALSHKGSVEEPPHQASEQRCRKQLAGVQRAA